MKKKSKFGLEEIDSKEKSQKIQEVFSSVASNYDLMNDLMSLGSHRVWKQRFFQVVKPRQSDIILDIASGTGDIAINFARACKGINLTCLDANIEMDEEEISTSDGLFSMKSFVLIFVIIVFVFIILGLSLGLNNRFNS